MYSSSEDSMRSMKDSHISKKGERIIASTSEDNRIPRRIQISKGKGGSVMYSPSEETRKF